MMTADEKLTWLLDHIGLHDPGAHHEILRLVLSAYPEASLQTRQAVIEAVLGYRFPEPDADDAFERETYIRFDWLRLLCNSDPECPVAKKAMDDILVLRPDLAPRPGDAAPSIHLWTTEELLAKPAIAWLDELLNFQDAPGFGPNRYDLLGNVTEAAKQRPAWALALVDALAQRQDWESDLWPAILRAWRDADPGIEAWQGLLNRLGTPEIQQHHASAIADLLYALVRDGGKPYALQLLNKANELAWPLWEGLDRGGEAPSADDWIGHAINRPGGVIVEFWLHGLSLSLGQRPKTESGLPEPYRSWFAAVVSDPSVVGGMGRSLLASQAHWLNALDAEWTQGHLIPLFTCNLDPSRCQQAWQGFLTWGRLTPSLATALTPAFRQALGQLDGPLAPLKKRFIEYFAAFLAYQAEDVLSTWIPDFFSHTTLNDRVGFAQQIGFLLRHMDDPAKQDLWGRWLRLYWQNRNQGLPARLEPRESEAMLGWVLQLAPVFPEAIDLARSGPSPALEHMTLLHQLSKGPLPDRYPDATARFLIHLCKGDLPGYHCPDIEELARRLITLATNSAVLIELCENLARLGCPGAADLSRLIRPA